MFQQPSLAIELVNVYVYVILSPISAKLRVSGIVGMNTVYSTHY